MAAIIFDLDGTLVDSAPDIHAAANRMLEEQGQPPLPLTVIKSFIGNGVAVLVARVKAHCHLAAPHEALLERFMHHYNAEPVTLTRLYPNVAESLAALADSGHRLGLCTNKPAAPARHILESFGIAGHFAALVGGDSLPQRKPDPAPLRAALSDLGGGPALFVGDSEVDAETAEASALPFVLFTLGYRKSDITAIRHDAAFADFAALPELVPGLMQRGG